MPNNQTIGHSCGDMAVAYPLNERYKHVDKVRRRKVGSSKYSWMCKCVRRSNENTKGTSIRARCQTTRLKPMVNAKKTGRKKAAYIWRTIRSHIIESICEIECPVTRQLTRISLRNAVSGSWEIGYEVVSFTSIHSCRS